MKNVRNATTLLCLTALILTSSCEKATESLINCIGESLLVTIQATPDATDPKKVQFSIKYTGSLTMSTITWDFADGSPVAEGAASTTHTYAVAGSYLVSATVKLQKANSTCVPNPQKNITVN